MNKIDTPTQAQLKKFWEWCGFKQLPTYRTYLLGDEHFTLLPDLDLNNLFKYAVPRLSHSRRIIFNIHNGINNRIPKTITEGWIVDIESNEFSYLGADYDPALALFWAIYKLIEDDKEVKA
jgi:hypothetical protein